VAGAGTVRGGSWDRTWQELGPYVRETYVARESSACGAKCWRGTATARRHFAFWKASCAGAVHSNILGPPTGDRLKGEIPVHNLAKRQ
jgi:hypothetical protein